MKIFFLKFLFIILFNIIFQSNINAENLSQGICKQPTTFATGSSVDAIALYYCNKNDIPSDQSIQNLIREIINKGKLPYLWFELKTLKSGNVNKNNPSSYDTQIFGYVNEKGNIYFHKAFQHDIIKNNNIQIRMLEQYSLAQNRWLKDALENGQVKYNTQSPYKSPYQDKGTNKYMQQKTNQLEKRLRGF